MNKLTKILLTLVLIVGIFGCDTVNESFTDGYSEDPNVPTEAAAKELFIASQVAVIELFEVFPAHIASMWTQQATGGERQYAGFHTYGVTNSDFNSEWFLAYTRILTNLKLAKEAAAEEGSQENLIAVANILEAMTIGYAAALWGDVPYTEAIKADEDNFSPAYDEQTAVYASAQSLLDQAISSLGSVPDLPGTADAFSFNGDVEQWIKAAYTLKAKFYMHTGEYQSAIDAAQNGIRETDGSDDLMFPHESTYQGDMNLWYSFIVFDRSGYLEAGGNNAVALMDARTANDPKTDESERRAFFYNAAGDEINTEAGGAYAIDADYPMLRASETHMIEAEAQLRLDQSVTGQQAAIDAMNLAREYNEDVYGGTYDDYLITDFADAGELEQQIYDETYLALLHQLEVFNFARRIDYQITAPGTTSGFLEPTDGSQFPERFYYPQSEIDANPNATPAINQTTADLFTPTGVNQ